MDKYDNDEDRVCTRCNGTRKVPCYMQDEDETAPKIDPYGIVIYSLTGTAIIIIVWTILSDMGVI